MAVAGTDNRPMRWSAGAVLVSLVGITPPAGAQPGSAPGPAQPEPEPRRKTPFDRGRVGLSFAAGSQTQFGARYFVVAGGGGYYVVDGVELGLGLAHQFGDGPSVTRTTPALRYVAQPLVGRSPLVPYVGVFYSHYFVGDGVADLDTAGTRGGLLYVSGSVVLGLGVVFERQVSECVMDCLSIYPDFTLSLAL